MSVAADGMTEPSHEEEKVRERGHKEKGREGPWEGGRIRGEDKGKRREKTLSILSVITSP
jgi:hypothetical protein